MIQPERLRRLNRNEARPGRYVLYWMQASQRAEDNHALEHAVRQANALRLPLVAVFGLTARFPEANLRHYAFMLQGLAETRRALEERGVRLVALRGSPSRAALTLADEAALLVTDRGYLRVQKRWRREVARRAPCPVVQVESDVVVPVETASHKEEYSAATLRRKLTPLLDGFLVPLRATALRRDSLGLDLGGLDELAHEDLPGVLRSLRVRRSVKPTACLPGGPAEAARRLDTFVRERLSDYDTKRNDPGLDWTSHLSPYLHFGQISPLRIALAVRDAKGVREEAKADFLEELIVRRELSMNFVLFNSRYGTYEALPDWARKSLAAHAADPREFVYPPETLERAETHDPYWNAAMTEMRVTGRMQNYMRMYWGKKIIEWSSTPREAFETTLRLNNTYFLDGRDPNSFAGVAWVFGKHDRPWTQRPIFGSVRYMNAAGLRRKFDIEAYALRMAALLTPLSPGATKK